eukprot:172378-Chlamydomonas_euryale.AAC.2
MRRRTEHAAKALGGGARGPAGRQGAKALNSSDLSTQPGCQLSRPPQPARLSALPGRQPTWPGCQLCQAVQLGSMIGTPPRAHTRVSVCVLSLAARTRTGALRGASGSEELSSNIRGGC